MFSMHAIRLRTPIVAAAAALAMVGCGGAAARYASHMDRGKQFLREGNLDKASIEIRNALQVEPKAAEALYLNGRVAEQRGNLREAAGSYQAAVDARPDYDQARASLGKIFIMAAAPERAVAIIEPGLRKHPDDPDLLAVRGAAEHQLKKEGDARADAERAVRLAPTNESAVALLAALYAQAGELDRAVSLVSGAVRQAPSSVDLHQLLASIYLSAGRSDQAEGQMRKLIELLPRELPPRLQLARFYAHARKLDEAQRILEEAVKGLPQSDEAKLALADFIATQRSRAQGEKTLRDFIAREPGNYDLRFGLGALLQRTGAAQEAIATYREVISRDGTGPKGLIARDRIAGIEASQGHFPQALALVTEVLAKNPRDGDALVLRANIALQHDDPTPAIADLRAVLRDQPKSVPLQRALARAYLAKGESALAEEALRVAADAAPDDPAVRIELAQFLVQSGRVEQAITLLEETVRRVPDNPQAREQLVRAYVAKHDLPAARTAADDLKTLRPESPVGFYLAGLVAQEQKQLDNSQKEFEHALQLNPGAIDVLTSLTGLELARGKNAAAIARARSAVERDPKNVSAVNLLGQTYLATNDLAHAAQTFSEAATLAPGWWMPHRNLARVKLVQNDPNGALAQYEAALKVAPLEPQLVVEVATLYERQGRIDDALASYEALYKNAPRARQLAANNLAMLLVTYKKDRASLDRARDLTSDFASSENGALLDTHGWVRFQRGEYKDALPVLERAAERAPDSKVIRYHLAMTELQLGERERARTDLESALSGSASFSGSEDARSVLASLDGRSG